MCVAHMLILAASIFLVSVQVAVGLVRPGSRRHWHAHRSRSVPRVHAPVLDRAGRLGRMRVLGATGCPFWPGTDTDLRGNRS